MQTNDSSDIAALLHGLPSNPSAGHSSITVTGGVSYFVPANGTIDGAAFAKVRRTCLQGTPACGASRRLCAGSKHSCGARSLHCIS